MIKNPPAMNFINLVIAISSYMKTTLHSCYNVFTYKSPPVVIVALGGLEPPRQLASGCQDRYVCQFHHSAVESGEGDLAKDCPSPKLPQIKHYHNICRLSIGKTIIDAHKTIMGDNYDMS